MPHPDQLVGGRFEPELAAEGGRQDQPRRSHRMLVVEADRDPVENLR